MTDPLYPRHGNSGPAPEVTNDLLDALRAMRRADIAVREWVDGETRAMRVAWVIDSPLWPRFVEARRAAMTLVERLSP